MTAVSPNTIWTRAFVDELARAGVREIVLAPGSRSTPLVMAFAAHGGFRLRVHLDERSAAFFALGVGKASGVPAAVVTTSGTAAANLLPAVVEAAQAEVPLVALTADRPPHLRGADANQAIDQLGLFGTYTRAFFEVGSPVAEGPALRHLRGLAARAVALAQGPPAGPVHLNFPFGKPLEPEEPGSGFAGFAAADPLTAAGRRDGEPYVRIRQGMTTPAPEALDDVARLLASPRGVIVAGPSTEPRRSGQAAVRLAERTGFPLLADPLSGARFQSAGGAHVVAAYDLFLRDAEVRAALAPSVVLRVGSTPTSAALQRWLLDHDSVPYVVVDGGGRYKDHGASATDYLRADAALTLAGLADRLGCQASDAWTRRWRGIERAALDVLAAPSGAAAPEESRESDVWPALAAALPARAALFVSSSMPIRDLDAFLHPCEHAWEVFANRGASGIDGIVSSAFGVASQHADPLVCVVGDVAFFHDQNGLLWSREDGPGVIFVLIDNDGGGIFHMLPIAEHEPHFTEYFATPHGLDFRHAAELHGLPFHDATVATVGEALAAALKDGRTAVLRVRTSRVESHHARRALTTAIASQARRVLAAMASDD